MKEGTKKGSLNAAGTGLISTGAAIATTGDTTTGIVLVILGIFVLLFRERFPSPSINSPGEEEPHSGYIPSNSHFGQFNRRNE